MHEIVHATFAVSGLSNILDDDNIEEAIVRVADYILFPVFKREYGNYRRKEKGLKLGLRSLTNLLWRLSQKKKQ